MRVLIVSSGNNATSTANPAAPACVGRTADFFVECFRDRLVQKIARESLGGSQRVRVMGYVPPDANAVMNDTSLAEDDILDSKTCFQIECVFKGLCAS